MKIETTILFGNLAETTIDEAKKYCADLKSKIQKQYPEFEVQVNLVKNCSGINPPTVVDMGNIDDSDRELQIMDDVDIIAEKIWETQ